MVNTHFICLLLQELHGVDPRSLLIEQDPGCSTMRLYVYGNVKLWVVES